LDKVDFEKKRECVTFCDKISTIGLKLYMQGTSLEQW